MKTGNITALIPRDREREVFEELVRTDCVTIERITSHGQSGPEGSWYDQERAEWVLVLKGSAGLRFDGDEGVVVLREGDWIHIPARRKHRVEWTSRTEATLWLAVHHA